MIVSVAYYADRIVVEPNWSRYLTFYLSHIASIVFGALCIYGIRRDRPRLVSPFAGILVRRGSGVKIKSAANCASAIRSATRLKSENRRSIEDYFAASVNQR